MGASNIPPWSRYRPVLVDEPAEDIGSPEVRDPGIAQRSGSRGGLDGENGFRDRGRCLLQSSTCSARFACRWQRPSTSSRSRHSRRSPAVVPRSEMRGPADAQTGFATVGLSASSFSHEPAHGDEMVLGVPLQLLMVVVHSAPQGRLDTYRPAAQRQGRTIGRAWIARAVSAPTCARSIQAVRRLLHQTPGDLGVAGSGHGCGVPVQRAEDPTVPGGLPALSGLAQPFCSREAQHVRAGAQRSEDCFEAAAACVEQ